MGCEAAAHLLDLNQKIAETERELNLARDRVLYVIRPWHEDTCAKRKAHESTVVVETPTGALRVSFQAATRAQLSLIGVRQIVAIAAK